MTAHRTRLLAGVGAVALTASWVVLATGSDSVKVTPAAPLFGTATREQPVEPEMRLPATASARIDGVGLSLRPATAPGLACLSLEGVRTPDGGTISGVCTQPTVIAQHGLLLSFSQADGGLTYYGIGPAGTKTVSYNGKLLATQRSGLFIIRNVPASSSGSFAFDVGNGTQSLEFSPLPPLPAP